MKQGTEDSNKYSPGKEWDFSGFREIDYVIIYIHDGLLCFMWLCGVAVGFLMFGLNGALFRYHIL